MNQIAGARAVRLLTRIRRAWAQAGHDGRHDDARLLAELADLLRLDQTNSFFGVDRREIAKRTDDWFGDNINSRER